MSEGSYNQCQDNNYLESTINFGEDYEMFLTNTSDGDSSGSEFGLLKKSKYTLDKIVKQIRKENFCQHTDIVSTLCTF